MPTTTAAIDLSGDIYSDLAAGESLIPLRELRNDKRLGSRPDKSVVYRWAAQGLETTKAGRLATTWPSVVRFFARRSGVTAQTPLRARRERDDNVSRAEKELAALGMK